MPVYTWKDKNTDKIYEVIRSFDDSGVPPEEPADADWVKVIGVPNVARGDNWGSKGNWAK